LHDAKHRWSTLLCGATGCGHPTQDGDFWDTAGVWQGCVRPVQGHHTAHQQPTACQVSSTVLLILGKVWSWSISWWRQLRKVVDSFSLVRAKMSEQKRDLILVR